MVNYLSLVNHQGRLFINPPAPEKDGLIAIIDYKTKNKLISIADIAFNAVGDSFLISDSRGQVTLFQLANNRYCTIVADLKSAPPVASFTGKYPQDQAMVCLKDKSIQIHSLNGKCIEKFQSGLNHKMEIKQVECNIKMGMVLSVSPDVCILWSNNQNSAVQNLRSLFAKEGCHFASAKFTLDGTKIATLFKDGEFIMWSLDASEINSDAVKFNFKTSLVTLFEMNQDSVICSGPQFPYLLIKSLDLTQQEEYFKLPEGCRGIDQMELLRDKNLLAFISEGYFYIVDLSTKDNINKIQVKLNIRIPNESIKHFDVDYNMTTVLLGTSNGNVFLYDIPKAFENERVLTKKRLDMGVEEQLVKDYLIRVNEDEIIDQLQCQSFQAGVSKISNQAPEASFMQSFQSPQMHMQSQQFSEINFNQHTINPFQTKSIHMGTYNQPHQSTIQQSNMRSQHVPIVSVNQSTNIRSPTKFQEKDENLNAGVPSIMSSQSKFQKSASIMKANKSTINYTQRQQQSTISQQKQSVLSIDQNYEPDFKFTQSTMNQAQMAQFNMPKLRQMLKQFGEYPEKYRNLTWKFLLELPLNKEAFSNLLRRGVHPAFKELHKKYPISSYRLYNKLVRIMSAIGYWCPLFLDVDYLPAIVFPFIKAIPNDDLLVFELVVSLISQWMQTWFENYPAQPLTILQAVETIIEREDSKLLTHLRSNAFSPSQYCWPLLSSLFTEVLNKDDWIRLVDHIYTYREYPELLVYFCAAFLISSKGQLLQTQTIEDLHCFVSRTSGLNFKKVMALTFKLHQKYKEDIITGNIANNLPLCKDGSTEYPQFNRYPEYIVTYQTKMREKVLLEEEEIRKKEQLLEELKQQAQSIVEKEEQFRKQQEFMLKAEEERKQKLLQEQEQMLQERIRLDEMTRIAKLEHIKRIEEAINNGLHYQENLKRQELKAAEEEFDHKQRATRYEYEARMQDEAISNMEFKANQRLLEMMQQRTSEEQGKKLKSEIEQRQREEEHRDRILQERWRLEDQEQRLKNELLRQTLTTQSHEMTQQADRAKIEQKFRLQEYEKEMQLLKIEEQRRLRQLEEEQILRKQQMLEEVRKKSQTMQSMEAQQMWEKLNDERERERIKTEERLRVLDEERHRLEMAIDREREERERYEQLERQKDLENEIVSIYSDKKVDESREQIERMQRQMAYDREEAERRRHEMMKKEVEIRESKDFMQFIRQTENKINDIVTRGQQQQLYRQSSAERGESDDFDQKRRIEYEVRMKRQIEERERQLKEQNEFKLKQITQQSRGMLEKENQNVNRSYGGMSYGQYPVDNRSFVNQYGGQQVDYGVYGLKTYSVNQSDQQQQDNYSQESSSLNSSHNDSALVQRHYDAKHRFDQYKREQQTTQNVFDYQPPYQLHGTNIPTSTMGSQVPPMDPRASESQGRTLQDSYLSSSSSSEEEGDSSSSHQNTNGKHNEDSYYSSYTSSQLSASEQSSHRVQ